MEQFWHCGESVADVSPGVWSIGETYFLAVPASSTARVEMGGDIGWQSDAPGRKEPRPTIVIERESELPAVMGALLLLGDRDARLVSVSIETGSGWVAIRSDGHGSIRLPESGDPLIAWY
jgi:hypothetical protein